MIYTTALVFMVAMVLRSLMVDATSVSVKDWKNCNDGIEYTHPLSHIKVLSDGNYKFRIDLSAAWPAEIGENSKFAVPIYYTGSGKKRILLTIRGTNGCEAMIKYVGKAFVDFAYDVFQNKPTCPLKSKDGTINARNATLDLSSIPFKPPIKGLFEVYLNTTYADTSKPMLCWQLDVEFA